MSRRIAAGLAVVVVLAGAVLLTVRVRGGSGLPEPATVDLGGVSRRSSLDCVTITGAYLDLLRAGRPDEAKDPLTTLVSFDPPDAVRRSLEFEASIAGVKADVDSQEERRKAIAIVAAWEAAVCPAAAAPTSVGASPAGR